jgi:hypothetical protein
MGEEFMNKLIAFLLCGFSVVLVACGEGEQPTTTTPEKSAVQIEKKECVDVVDPLIIEIGRINSGLTIGYDLTQYTKRVREAKYVYDQIDVDALSEDCVVIGAYIETALRQHVKAQALWAASPYVPDKVLEHLWNRATLSTEKAIVSLENYGAISSNEEGQVS